MPCRDNWGTAEDFAEYQRKIDKLTRMLCGLCKVVEDFTDGDDDVMVIDKVKNLRKWWNAHQAADRKREARQKVEKEKRRKISIALSKLTDEERELLGIPNIL